VSSCRHQSTGVDTGRTKIGFYHNAWFARPKDAAGYLLDMAVHPEQQRRGLGRRAMEMAEQVARKSELRAIRLDAYQGRPEQGVSTGSADTLSYTGAAREGLGSSISRRF
jgi:GNAT superfamily N-acetyltransferase